MRLANDVILLQIPLGDKTGSNRLLGWGKHRNKTGGSGGMRVAFLFTEFTQLFILLFLEGRATGFAIQIIFEMKTLELRSWIKLKDKTLAAFLLLIFEKA